MPNRPGRFSETRDLYLIVWAFHCTIICFGAVIDSPMSVARLSAVVELDTHGTLHYGQLFGWRSLEPGSKHILPIALLDLRGVYLGTVRIISIIPAPWNCLGRSDSLTRGSNATDCITEDQNSVPYVDWGL
jgi:hypothetical protein